MFRLTKVKNLRAAATYPAVDISDCDIQDGPLCSCKINTNIVRQLNTNDTVYKITEKDNSDIKYTDDSHNIRINKENIIIPII